MLELYFLGALDRYPTQLVVQRNDALLENELAM